MKMLLREDYLILMERSRRRWIQRLCCHDARDIHVEKAGPSSISAAVVMPHVVAADVKQPASLSFDAPRGAADADTHAVEADG